MHWLQHENKRNNIGNLSPPNCWLVSQICILLPCSVSDKSKDDNDKILPASSGSGCYSCFCFGCCEGLPHAHGMLCCIFQTDISYLGSGSCYDLGKCPLPATGMTASCNPRKYLTEKFYWNSYIAVKHPI